MFKELFVSPQTGSEFEINSDFGNGTLVCSRKLGEGTYRVRIQSDDLQLLEMLEQRLSQKWSNIKGGDHISCAVSSEDLAKATAEAEQAIENIYEEEAEQEEPGYDYEDLTVDYTEEGEEEDAELTPTGRDNVFFMSDPSKKDKEPVFISPQTGSIYQIIKDYGDKDVTLVALRYLPGYGEVRIRVQSFNQDILYKLISRLASDDYGFTHIKNGDHISATVPENKKDKVLDMTNKTVLDVVMAHLEKELEGEIEKELEEELKKDDILLEDVGETVEQPEISKQKAEDFPAEVAFIGGKKIIIIPQEYQVLGMLDDETIVVKKK